MALSKIKLSDNTTVLANVKSVTFKEVVNADDNIRPGCVGSSSIEVEVFNTQANAVSAGSTLYYYQIDQNETETLIGRFTAEPSITTKNSYRFVAYDNAQKLNADFSQWLQANQSNFPQTVKQLVQQACTIAGVTLGSTSWPLSTQNVQAFYADGLTCRDIISYAAEIACKFVRCHTDGKLYFDWYTSNSNSIAPSAGTNQYAYKQDGLTYANFTTTALARVAVHPSGEDDVAYIYPVNVTSGNTLDIKDNLLLTGASASFYNSVAQTVYTAMSSLGTYRPMTASLFPRENPFRAGDIVSVTDSQSVTFTAPITGQTVSNSAATLESVGNETYTDYSGSAKGLTQLASDIVRINKLKVGWAEIDNAIVNYLTANDITAQNLTIVDENGTVLATYNASGIVLGQTSEGHAEIDNNSFELYDEDGNIYFVVGDLRNSSGVASLKESKNFYETTGYTDVNYTISSITRVIINGNVLQPYQYSYSGKTVSFVYYYPAGTGFTIEYETTDPIYRIDFGERKPSSYVGGNSIVFGEQNTASGDNSFSNGVNNTASGDNSSILGGTGNTVSGQNACVVDGNGNTAIGNNSTVFGKGNEAGAALQFVFGQYNAAYITSDPNDKGQYIELVGNGTANNARSNARTLDWNGNEVLAGGLTTGGAVSVGGNISVSGSLSVTNVAQTLINLGLGNIEIESELISPNSSKIITIDDDEFGVIVALSASTNLNNIYTYNCTTSGTVVCVNYRTASNISVTTGTNSITISNTNTGNNLKIRKIRL